MRNISPFQDYGSGPFLTFGQGALPPNPYRPVGTGGNVYYNGGFLPAGAGQTSSMGGGGILGAITSGLQTFLPVIGQAFQQRPGGGFGQVPHSPPPS